MRVRTTFDVETYEIVREALMEMFLDAVGGVDVERATRKVSDYLSWSLVGKNDLRSYVERAVFDLKGLGLIEHEEDTTQIEFRLAAHGRAGLMDATMRGHTAIVGKLLDRAIDSATKNAALVSAVINDRAAIVRLLIDSGAEVNAREALFGRTPLMYATSRTSKKTVELLIAAGAEEGR